MIIGKEGMLQNIFDTWALIRIEHCELGDKIQLNEDSNFVV